MMPSEAARTIGMSDSQLRQAIRKKLIPAKKKPNPLVPGAYIYDLRERDVIYYKNNRPRPGPKKKEKNNDSDKTVLQLNG